MPATVGRGAKLAGTHIGGSIARAFETGRPWEIVAALASLGDADAFPAGLFAAPDPARYSRRRLWTDPGGRFVVAGMTWLPGQGSPIHDHAGRWGAEFVVRGTMRETAYRITDRAYDDLVRLAAERSAALVPGEAGAVQPHTDIHALLNVSGDVAHTVHVYSSLVDECTRFDAGDAGWWTAVRFTFAASA